MAHSMFCRAQPSAEEAKRADSAAAATALQAENARLQKELDLMKSAAHSSSFGLVGAVDPQLCCFRSQADSLKKVVELQETTIRNASKLPQQVRHSVRLSEQ